MRSIGTHSRHFTYDLLRKWQPRDSHSFSPCCQTADRAPQVQFHSRSGLTSGRATLLNSERADDWSHDYSANFQTQNIKHNIAFIHLTLAAGYRRGLKWLCFLKKRFSHSVMNLLTPWGIPFHKRLHVQKETNVLVIWLWFCQKCNNFSVICCFLFLPQKQLRVHISGFSILRSHILPNRLHQRFQTIQSTQQQHCLPACQ